MQYKSIEKLFLSSSFQFNGFYSIFLFFLDKKLIKKKLNKNKSQI